MFKNYLKIAWRSLLRDKGFSAINIIGLSIGVAACLLITLYVIDERSYDSQVTNRDNIYRLTQFSVIDGEEAWGAHHSALMASTIDKEFDEVNRSGRILDNKLMYGAGSNEISFNDDLAQYHEERFAYVDQSIVDILDLPIIQGVANSALNEPQTLIISESKSQKFFKGQNPINQIIYLNNDRSEPYKITGVFKDFPEASNFDYDFLLTLKGVEFGEGEQMRWVQSNYFNFIELSPETDVATFENRMTQVIFPNYLIPALKSSGYSRFARIIEDSKLELQPLKDIHLHSEGIRDGKTHGDIRFVWIFGAIALFILMIACINFINLSTAKSANRAKEVGLRKVVGSGKGKLVAQFLMESVVITVIAFIIGVFLAFIALPFFNTIAGKTLSIPWNSWFFIPTILVAAIFVGLVAGLYPAFYLSGFKPIHVLKGKLSTGAKSSKLRSGLVVFQFTVSIILIAGTLIINNQIDFILNKKVGFEKDQVLQIHGVNMLGDRLIAFSDEISQLQGVTHVSNSDYLPVAGTKRNGNTFYNSQQPNIEGVPGQAWIIDEGYLQTFGMNLVAGRNFEKDRTTDDRTVIINQTLAQQLGMEDPIGKELKNGSQNSTIIGVVEDFNFESLQQEVGGVALYNSVNTTITSIKLNSTDVTGVLAALETTWKQFVPNLDFRYTFMDESYAQMYANVKQMSKLVISFAVLAILVACLGLFALSSFLVEQRRKELSVRKVLGASVQSLFKLLTSYFLILVVIAICIAVPVAYFIMDHWLQDYAYRISITWEIFALSGILAIFIALATISYHAMKAAMINPAKNLRTH